MGMLSSGSGGDDATIIKLGVMCATITIVATLLFSILLPSAAAYSFEEVYNEREQLSSYTGESITSNTPWRLVGVYTPWQVGHDYRVTPEGFLYGDTINDYPGLNTATGIKLDPSQKSNVPLYNSTVDATIRVREGFTEKWGAFGILPDIVISLAGWQEQFKVDKDVTYPVWNFTGYRYEFDPMLPFQDDKASAVDGKLSIVWYSYEGAEGLAGGLVVYGRDNVILASYSAADIIADYNLGSAYSTKYSLDFDGITVDLNIRFDPEVLAGYMTPETAWTTGAWTLSVSSVSAGNFLDLMNSSSYSTSLGNMVDTFVAIFTFNVPTVDSPYYTALLWLIVGLPAELCILLFCSRFGIAGVGAGLLGSALLFLG